MYYSKNKVRNFSGRRRLNSRRRYRMEEEEHDDDVGELPSSMFMGHDKEKTTGIEVEENHVYFYCPIMERESLELVRILRRLDIEMKYLADRIGLSSRPPIHLHIQSPGGDIFSGLNICDAITSCGTEVYTYVEGSAASCGTLISVCGKKKFMTRNSFMLIHQPQIMWAGKHDEFLDEIENQKHIYAAVKQIYLSHTNIKPKQLDEMLKHELWLPSSKCLELGLVDEIC